MIGRFCNVIGNEDVSYYLVTFLKGSKCFGTYFAFKIIWDGSANKVDFVPERSYLEKTAGAGSSINLCRSDQMEVPSFLFRPLFENLGSSYSELLGAECG